MGDPSLPLHFMVRQQGVFSFQFSVFSNQATVRLIPLPVSRLLSRSDTAMCATRIAHGETLTAVFIENRKLKTDRRRCNPTRITTPGNRCPAPETAVGGAIIRE